MLRYVVYFSITILVLAIILALFRRLWARRILPSVGDEKDRDSLQKSGTALGNGNVEAAETFLGESPIYGAGTAPTNEPPTSQTAIEGFATSLIPGTGGQPSTTTIPPERRGGHPRGWFKRQIEKIIFPRSKRSRPTLYLRRESESWCVYARITQGDVSEIPKSIEAVVVQENPLGLRFVKHGLYGPLESPPKKIIATWDEGEKTFCEIDAVNNCPLIFHLAGSEGNESGWLIRRPTSGFVAVLAPAAWERDEITAGPPPIEPGNSSIRDWRVHFFDLSAECQIAFTGQDAPKEPITVAEDLFRFAGNFVLRDASRAGPVFGPSPPRLTAQNWSALCTIVVGEEGEGANRWRTHRRLQQWDPKDGENIILQLIGHRSGWYFVRFYDGEDQLIQSTDFRFVNGLVGVDLDVARYPGKEGHKAALVRINCDKPITLISKVGKIVSQNPSTNMEINVPASRQARVGFGWA